MPVRRLPLAPGIRPLLALVATVLVLAPAPARSQTATTSPPRPEARAATTPDKRPLEIADYARWRTIDGEALSPDGAWVAWSHGRVRGDDTLHVKAVEGATTHTIPFGTSPVFSDDGRWVAYDLGVSFADQ